MYKNIFFGLYVLMPIVLDVIVRRWNSEWQFMCVIYKNKNNKNIFLFSISEPFFNSKSSIYNLRPWRCIQQKPLWRAFSNQLISEPIHTAMEHHIIHITVMDHRCHLEWEWQWRHSGYRMVSMPLVSHIKVCGVNIASNLVSLIIWLWFLVPFYRYESEKLLD